MFFERLQTATQHARAGMLKAAIIEKAVSSTISLEEYVAYLTQAYHHVKHTVPLLMAVGARLPEQPTGR